MDTMDKVQGVQADWTMSTEDWTLSIDSLDKVQSDLVKKTEVKVASLEIYINTCISF